MPRGLATRLASVVVVSVLGGCGLPIPLPVSQAGIDCVRIADDVCGRTAESLGWGDVRIIAMRLECTQMACTPANGSVEVTIGYRDGTMQRQSVGWSQAGGFGGGPVGPMPPVPVDPAP
jgi:hypothetical protein